MIETCNLSNDIANIHIGRLEQSTRIVIISLWLIFS